MKTQYLLVAVGVVVAVLLLASLRKRPAPIPAARGPQRAAVPQAAAPMSQQESSLRRTDAEGNTWSLDLAGGQSLAALESGGAKAGMPIVVKTDIQRSGEREVSVGLLLEGQAGEPYRPVVKKNGTQVAAPGLRVVNEAGQVVTQGTFRYG